MNRTLLILAAAFWSVVLVTVDARAADVDFANQVMPIFTRFGCNTGACHGAAIGRGGFKLSLYGGSPKADYEAIVRQLEGRRINLAQPEESLLLLKPTATIKHGGNRVIDYGDPSTELLLDWIKQGAAYTAARELRRIEVTPPSHVAEVVGQAIPLRVTAYYADGSQRDVTDWTVFAAEDDSAVQVEMDEATATVQRRGRHIVVARYATEVVPIELIVPLTETKVDLSTEPRHNVIDEQVLKTLTQLGLPASPPVDDITFLRRVTLDLTGRLPNPEQVEAFLADTSPHKRSQLVDRLLASEAFTEYWTLQLAKLLRIRSGGRGGSGQDGPGVAAYHRWLADQLRDGTGYDELARTLLTALGDTHEHGPANFYRTTGNAGEQAEFMTELFMGSRLKCANCHNHPLDRWTQDDYHGLAAIFAKLEGGQVIAINPDAEVTHPVTLEPARPRIPGGRLLPATDPDGRQALADWLTDADNPYFAKAIVNRLWQRMMGRGLVEPVDDLRATNPATHPVLLDQLAEDFVRHDYQLRHTLKVIACSATYARSANATPLNRVDDRFYSHALRRPLEPEVLADAISDVLDIPEKYGEEPSGTRAVALMSPRTPSRSLDILGRCSRDVSCESAPPSTDGLRRMLHLLNGELLNQRLQSSDGRLEKLLAAGKSPSEIVEAFYLAAFSRRPSASERRFWDDQFAKGTPAGKQREWFEDFLWGLLTCEEFRTNH